MRLPANTPCAFAIGLILVIAVLLAVAAAPRAHVRLADDGDRAAFRSWFVLLPKMQFDRPAPEVTDCAALVRFAMREALRQHAPELRPIRCAAVHAEMPRPAVVDGHTYTCAHPVLKRCPSSGRTSQAAPGGGA